MSKRIVKMSKTPDTKDFILNQTMLRIKDPKKSLDFYINTLGMTLLYQKDFPNGKFSLYFLAYHKEDLDGPIPEDPVKRKAYTLKLNRAIVELTHNWGTEDDESFSYHNGNSDPKGFGHIGVCVPDVYKASERFEQLGVEFIKKPNEGRMPGLAFIKDPDGYWIEIFSAKTLEQQPK